MNAEQIDEKGNWAASNPAYELFCVQAEVHNHQRMPRSPSPDNTEAQMPDMPSEVAMDGDNDSLVNVKEKCYGSFLPFDRVNNAIILCVLSSLKVCTDDYSSTEVTGSDRESFTLNGNGLNDVYENVNVADNRTLADAESIRRTAASPVPPASGAYENFADNRAYAMVRVSNGSTTYENVESPKVVEDEQYEPIETPSQPPQAVVDVNACYENVDQPSYENVDQPSYENIDQPSYENIDQPSYENLDNPPKYENLDQGQPTNDQASYENLVHQASYENVGEEVAPSVAAEPIDVDSGDVYENVNLGQGSASRALELVNVYEDVIPPPPTTAETEEVIYHQVKVLRRSIQEVNELLREDPSMLQVTLDASPYPPLSSASSSPVKSPTSPVVLESAREAQKTKGSEALSMKKRSIAKDGRETSRREFVIRDISVDDPPSSIPSQKDVRLSLSPKRMSTGNSEPIKQQPGVVSAPKADESQAKDQLSLSLPSLLNSPNKKAAPCKISNSLPPTPVHHPEPAESTTAVLLRQESVSVSSKRRFESEIGRDLLRERRIRNEIESSRSPPSSNATTSPTRRQSTPESPTIKLLSSGGKPALPIKISPKKLSGECRVAVPATAKRTEPLRPTTLETSFDYDPSPPALRHTSSLPLAGSPLSPVSPSSEGRNFSSPGVRKTSVKELLNKFQTGGVGSGETNQNERSPQHRSVNSTPPTSPLKPVTPVISPSSEELSKKVKDKENIEVLLSPSPTKLTGSLDGTDALSDRSIDSNRDSSLEDSNNKDILRQKSLAVGIDMSDPKTRLRIERYKEERRSFLREKYKSESFRSEGKEDAVIVRLKQKAGSPTHSEGVCVTGTSTSIPPPSDQLPEPGLIDEDVNVKERAAQWSAPGPKTSVPSVPVILSSNNPRSCSEAVAIAAAPQQKRIRDMAAMFEKESP